VLRELAAQLGPFLLPQAAVSTLTLGLIVAYALAVLRGEHRASPPTRGRKPRRARRRQKSVGRRRSRRGAGAELSTAPTGERTSGARTTESSSPAPSVPPLAPWRRPLDSLGSIAVSVGLLGSVYSFMRTFSDTPAGRLDIDAVVAGLGTAYTTTGVGLATAIVAAAAVFLLDAVAAPPETHASTETNADHAVVGS